MIDLYSCLLLLLLLLLLKKVGSARQRESDAHPISPKTPAPQYQPIDRKKRKGKIERRERENNSILHKHQYGFRAKKSTTQAILHFLQYLYKHIDSGNVVFSLFLDFRKAFDCVNPEILLSKLNTCGVRGVALD